MLSGFVAELIYHPHVELAGNAYPIAIPEDTRGSGAPAQEEEVLEPITPLLADADPAAGEQLASRQCATCHTFTEGGAASVGPTLYALVAQPIAAQGDVSSTSALSHPPR